jgi:hypothetical protein
LDPQSAAAIEATFKPMVTLDIDTAMFSAQWQLCDMMTEYFSTLAGQFHADPSRYANLLSAAINELVELAYRLGPTDGTAKLSFRLERNNSSTRMKTVFLRADAPGDIRLDFVTEETGMPALPGTSAAGREAMRPDPFSALRQLSTVARFDVDMIHDVKGLVSMSVDFPTTEDLQ